MALIHCNFFSEVLGIASAMYVILPQPKYNPDKEVTAVGSEGYPTLYLLHGLSDDYTIWQRRTSIERYADALGIAVVMPAVNRSFYTDMARGHKYWTFISEELPYIARSLFPLSDKRENNFVAGLSMGGYGAFKLALRCPDKFAAAASLSGVLDISTWVNNSWSKEAENIFGKAENVLGSENDIFYLAEKVANSDGPKPKLFQCCGTEDFLYEGNIRFRDFCKELPLDLTYEDEPGIHEWGYWDMKIQNVLKWLPLSK